MIVSGGKILAIGKVNVGTGLSGDGVALPIGLTSEYPIVSSYDISAGQNIFVDRFEDSPNNNITFFISANGGTSTSDLQAGTYIDITNDFINVDLDLINSASSGYRALETIQNNSAVWEKDWSTEIETSVTGKLDKTVFDDYADDIASWQNTTEGNIVDINQSVIDVSAYIEEHEDEWILSGKDVEMETLTPDYLQIESADIGTNGVKFSISAIEPTKYNAGDWIDSENLETGTISVSGHRGIFLNDPLYWTSADIDGSIRYYVNVRDLNSSECGCDEVFAKVTGDHVISNYLGTHTDNITYDNNTRTFSIDSLANVNIIVNYNLHLSPTANDLVGSANLIVADELVSKNIFGFIGEENINASFYKREIDEVRLETYFDADVVNSYEFTATVFGHYK